MEPFYIHYNKVGQEILRTYRAYDDVIVYHEDDHRLDTIEVKIPEPPQIETIHGYGLPAHMQMFEREVIPAKLIELTRVSIDHDDFYNKLEINRTQYKDEIEWLRRQWEYRLNGKWYFINGQPTYVDGWHWFYLNNYNLDIGLPAYRSRDRKFFIFMRFAYTDTTLPNGVDLKRRVCVGVNYPKHRREGATYKAACIMYEIISRTQSVNGGIQAMDGDTAGKVFQEKLINPWRKMPVWFKPVHDGTTNPQASLDMYAPAFKAGKGTLNITTGLESTINWATTAKMGFYDGNKLYVLHNDEIGKTLLEDVYRRHQVQYKCLTLGGGLEIVGFEMNTSTVGEMDKGGGRNFKKLCEDSHYGQRNQTTGQTKTGLYNLFLPGYDGMEGFIDKFGNSIIEDPTPEEAMNWFSPVRDSRGKLVGAKRYILDKRSSYIDSDNPEDMENYEEEVRMTPISFSECFITAGKGNGLNLRKITARMNELEYMPAATQRGNFKWFNNIPDTKVIWEPSPNGKWRISLKLPEHETNQVVSKWATIEDKRKLVKIPAKPNRFTACGDPYTFRVTRSKRRSMGGGAVFWHRDTKIDPDSKPMNEWESYRTVCTYKNRPKDPDEYAEDMLMMCVYFGAMMYPEINEALIWNHFVRRNYDGFLKYFIDIKGNIKATPGFFNRGDIPEDIFRHHQSYIENHCEREMHIEVLEEAKEINGPDELTDYDLFVAVGGAQMGAEIDYSWMERVLNKTRDVPDKQLNDYMPKRRY